MIFQLEILFSICLKAYLQCLQHPILFPNFTTNNPSLLTNRIITIMSLVRKKMFTYVGAAKSSLHHTICSGVTRKLVLLERQSPRWGRVILFWRPQQYLFWQTSSIRVKGKIAILE